MSRDDIAIALEKAAEGLAEAAFALRASEQPVRPVSAAAGPSTVAADTSVIDQGECPAHHRAWKLGKFGEFCTAKSDDPAWSNRNGYCTITPKNAPDWLRVNGVAT